MNKPDMIETLKSGKILLSDGAWGTAMQAAGLRAGECPELWCIDRPDDIFNIAKSYIDAGADMVECNSFCANRSKLEHYGLSGHVCEINEAAARISRAAADRCADGYKWVIGSMGPTGKMLIMEEITEREMYDGYSEQAQALEAGGADAVCIETMSDIEEAAIAIRAVRETTGLIVMCTFTFDKSVTGEYRTMFGITPADAVRAAKAAGAHISGTNCGNGIERMIEIVREMHSAEPDVPLLVHANAGLPQNIDGRDVFPDTPEYMAGFAAELAAAGACIIGGCCGTTPEHIRAIGKQLAKH